MATVNPASTAGEDKSSQSPFGTFVSAGPEAQVSMLVEAMNRSLGGPPGFVISLTSLKATPGVSPWPLVDAITPSYR
jgi:hypothetical protein